MILRSHRQTLSQPYSSLAVLFVLWKGLLLLLAVLSPGSGYDTSTSLLFQLETSPSSSNTTSSKFTNLLSEKLGRWDAIYFTSIAQHGYVYEQEWAFGWGFAMLSRVVARLLFLGGVRGTAMAAMLIANISHLLSVLVLYKLAKTLAPASRNGSNPFVAAALHIISPAGLFLSAPYAESLFSVLQFSAILVYCWSTPGLVGPISDHTSQRLLSHDLYLVLSGVLFAIAATVRGNALFAGCIYAYDVVALLPHLLPLPRSLSTVRHAFSNILAGLLILAGFALPQFLAYQEYCTGGVTPSPVWCSETPPSIFAYVQSHYWVNGFLRYWTLSNLPLFVLAAPMLVILCASSISALDPTSHIQSLLPIPTSNVLKRLAILQLVLASIVFTTANVQIITRIASGYPLWYIWIAQHVQSEQPGSVKIVKSKTKSGRQYAQLITRWMVMYALIQGGLYASFLPPA